ncbi:asparagine synthase (glutamine-hydrolyzing) [soil metagenome]
MCGIAGIIWTVGQSHRAALGRMKAALVHRGPDDEGTWEARPDASGWGPLLGFRRLSILDLSTAAAQPMVDPKTGDVIVTNGEIYNFLELRRRLSLMGEHFESSGDTAVMLRHLAIGGRRSISDLRGMFAFAHWDVDERTLTLARDPLGIKPLYLARNPDPHGDWSLVFASEVRAILASGLLGRHRIDPQAIGSLVWNGFMVNPVTAIDGITTVLPGEALVFDERGRELSRETFWNLPEPSQRGESEASFGEALEESVRMHLTSDVPIGVFLSGGVDSSSIANLAQRNSSERVHTFTMAFEEEERNEGPFARRVADAIGTDHHETVITQARFLAQLDSALNSLDQPTFDGVNSYFISHAVREAGFVVVLAGAGGDEIFGGYESFRLLPRMMHWSARGRVVPRPLRAALARLVARVKQPPRGELAQQSRWAKLPAMANRDGDLLGLYQLAYALFLPEFQDRLLRSDVKSSLVDGLPEVMHARLNHDIGGRSVLEAVSALEQRMFLGERLLRDIDATSMSASLETRLPLVDSVLLEHASHLPIDLRYQPVGSKAMLRRVGLRSLQPKLFERPKSGFEMPFDRWLRGGLGETIGEALQDPVLVRPTGLDPAAVDQLWTSFQQGHPGLYWSRVWALFVFVRWCHIHHAYVGD